MVPPVLDMASVRQRPGPAILADVRWYLDGRSGQRAYEDGHIPGAIFVDLDKWLAGDARAGGGRHPLPSPETFAAGMVALGIGDDDTVIGYDDQGGVIAARLVWMLRVTGHEAALLDGGLQGYEGPLEKGRPVPAGATGPGISRAHFTARPWPAERLAGIDDAANPANVVIDARSADRYHGRDEHIDPRAGHIPGAVSLPCRDNLDQSGRFLQVPALRDRFSKVGVTDGGRVVSYCGSGVTACHNLLALELCGLGQGRLYPGSWSEYAASAGRPVAT